MARIAIATEMFPADQVRLIKRLFLAGFLPAPHVQSAQEYVGVSLLCLMLICALRCIRGIRGVRGIRMIRGIRDIRGIRMIRGIRGIRGIRMIRELLLCTHLIALPATAPIPLLITHKILKIRKIRNAMQ